MNTKSVLNLSAFLDETNMSLTNLAVLAAIELNPNSRVGDLAVPCGMSIPNVSLQVNKLRKSKLVNLVNSEEDRRVSFVNLTEVGQEYLNSAFKVAAESGETKKVTAAAPKKKVVKKAAPKKAAPKKTKTAETVTEPVVAAQEEVVA